MKVITSRVVGGKIEIETDLREGTPVAILAAVRQDLPLQPMKRKSSSPH